MITLEFLLFSFLFSLTCMSVQVQYEYADGNGNTYHLTTSTLAYLPVTPERSSSARYSGGEPKEVKISQAEFARLSALLDKAIGNTSEQQEKREMMTGLIIKGGVRVVLKPNSTGKKQIEEELRKILNR